MGMNQNKVWQIVDLNRHGLTDKEIAKKLKVSERTIVRYKARLKKEKKVKFKSQRGRKRIEL